MASGDLIQRIISTRGRITVGDFMQLAAQQEKAGYYRHQPAIGSAGDFVTSPEISQIFGEILGLCMAQNWLERARSEPVHIVEFGPGRGTLMADAFRAIRQTPAAVMIDQIHLVETNAVLIERQRAALAGEQAIWHQHIGSLPDDGMLFIFANEFLDALPARQFCQENGLWFERIIVLERDRLGFATEPVSGPMRTELDERFAAVAEDCRYFEVSPAREAWMADIAARLSKQKGALLAIDYGDWGAERFGDSLQAVRGHRKVDVLGEPGLSDITTRVDFRALANIAMGNDGVILQGPAEQGQFLRENGAELRLARLAEEADDAKARSLMSGLARLTEDDEMGVLFKVLGLTDRHAPPLPGFGAVS